MSVETTAVETSVLLPETSWQRYVEMRDSDAHRNKRMTYDRGTLELMSPSKRHERLGYLIGRCIDVWTLRKRIPVQACRTTTFRREDLLRGLEPDNCYYIENERVVHDREDVDLSIDPPPDLAVEVDITSSSIDRIEIYAALKVPEIWRWQPEKLHLLRLDASGAYTESPGSLALPGFPCEPMVRILTRRKTIDDTTLIEEFQRECQSSSE